MAVGLGSVTHELRPAAGGQRRIHHEVGGSASSSDIRPRRRGAPRRLEPLKTQKSWRRPMFPKGCPLSIFGAGELNFRVRDGNGCGLSARVTRKSAAWTMSFGSGRVFDLARVHFVARHARGGSQWSQPLILDQLLKRSSPRPLVRLSFIRHRTSTCRLSNRWSPCGLTWLTQWGTSSRGELRT